MKKFRKLIPAIAMLLMSAVMMSTSSFAWFSISKEVTVSSMQVTAVAEGSLIVNLTNQGTDKTDAALALNTTVAMPGSSHAISPCTYFAGSGYAKVNVDVDATTGLPASGNEATLTECTVLDTTAEVYGDNKYYVDYVVYLSSAANELSGTLKATVDFGDSLAYERSAVKVAFTVGAAKRVTAGQSKTEVYPVNTAPTSVSEIAAVATASTTDVTVTLSVTNFKIPVYNVESGNNAIPVLMRVYFDGNMTTTQEIDGTSKKVAIVNSQNAPSTDALNIGVKFTIG